MTNVEEVLDDGWTHPALQPFGWHGDWSLLTSIHALLARLPEPVRIQHFFESGTHLGSTLHYLMRSTKALKSYVSCDIETAVFWPAVEHVATLCAPTVHTHGAEPPAPLRAFLSRRALCEPQVHLHLADSTETLTWMVDSLPDATRASTLFWLDAHPVGVQFGDPNVKWPLPAELRAVTHHWVHGFIMIDDFSVPGRPEFGSDGDKFNVEYLTQFIDPDATFAVYYPAYPGVGTSGYHPLRGTVLIEFTHPGGLPGVPATDAPPLTRLLDVVPAGVLRLAVEYSRGLPPSWQPEAPPPPPLPPRRVLSSAQYAQAIGVGDAVREHQRPATCQGARILVLPPMAELEAEWFPGHTTVEDRFSDAVLLVAAWQAVAHALGRVLVEPMHASAPWLAPEQHCGENAGKLQCFLEALSSCGVAGSDFPELDADGVFMRLHNVTAAADTGPAVVRVPGNTLASNRLLRAITRTRAPAALPVGAFLAAHALAVFNPLEAVVHGTAGGTNANACYVLRACTSRVASIRTHPAFMAGLHVTPAVPTAPALANLKALHDGASAWHSPLTVAAAAVSTAAGDPMLSVYGPAAPQFSVVSLGSPLPGWQPYHFAVRAAQDLFLLSVSGALVGDCRSPTSVLAAGLSLAARFAVRAPLSANAAGCGEMPAHHVDLPWEELL